MMRLLLFTHVATPCVHPNTGFRSSSWDVPGNHTVARSVGRDLPADPAITPDRFTETGSKYNPVSCGKSIKPVSGYTAKFEPATTPLSPSTVGVHVRGAQTSVIVYSRN